MILKSVLFSILLICIGCKNKKNETLPSEKQLAVEDQSGKFKESQALILLAGDTLRAIRYALPSVPRDDMLKLTSLYWQQPQTNGKFSLFPVYRGEQYNLLLPNSAGYAFINAATLFYLSEPRTNPYYIVQGKVWLNAWKKKITIRADECVVNVDTNSKINVENYSNGTDIIISLLEGSAILHRYNETFHLNKDDEIWINKSTGILQRKMATIDASSWTLGWLRHFSVGYDYMFRELSRLYAREFIYNGPNVPTSFPNLEYRTKSLDDILESISYSQGFDSIIRDDSIWVSKYQPAH